MAFDITSHVSMAGRCTSVVITGAGHSLLDDPGDGCYLDRELARLGADANRMIIDVNGYVTRFRRWHLAALSNLKIMVALDLVEPMTTGPFEDVLWSFLAMDNAWVVCRGNGWGVPNVIVIRAVKTEAEYEAATDATLGIMTGCAALCCVPAHVRDIDMIGFDSIYGGRRHIKTAECHVMMNPQTFVMPVIEYFRRQARRIVIHPPRGFEGPLR